MSAQRFLAAQVKAVDADAGTWTAVASVPSVDRDDEIVAERAFEPLPRQPVPVRDAHFGGQLVGSGRPHYQGNQLLLEGRFASTPRAQEVRTLVVEGHLASMSVVFLPLADEQVDGRRNITRAELLAVDFGEIPSNRDARVLAARSLDRQGLHHAHLLAAQARISALEADLAALPAPAAPTSLGKAYSDLSDLQDFITDLSRR
jgi:hypothetical protein